MKNLQNCIDACNVCMVVCEQCANESMAMYVHQKCVKDRRYCAYICDHNVRLYANESTYSVT